MRADVAHRRELERLGRDVEAVVRADPRFLALLAAGSLADSDVDAFSDLDLVLVADPAEHAAALADAPAIAAAVGSLLACFTGEHVGEPRLLVCLYGPEPLLHCDLKLVTPEDLRVRVDEPIVLWEREGSAVSSVLRESTACYPEPDAQWIEDRFWVWIHYAAAKLRRGELLEVVDALGVLRQRVLGPLLLRERGLVPNGVRRVEHDAPDAAALLADTIAIHDAADCWRALRRATEIYGAARDGGPPAEIRASAERAALVYLEESRP